MNKVLISDSLSEIAIKTFNENGINCDIKTDLETSELKKIIKNYSALVVRSATKVTKEIIESGINLKVIGRAGAGVDNIDLECAKNNNIIVMNTPGGNTNATAEHAFSLIFALYKNIIEANISTHKGLWEKKKFKGLELKDKKIGLIGFGNVATRVAEISKNFNMKIITFSKSFDLRKNDFTYVKSVSFDELISTSDIVSFHCKAQKDNKPIITMNEINKMKKSSIIINTARGNLVDEIDLKHAINKSLISGAAIDVFSEEPAKNNILFGEKNIILTPHIAASTKEAQINVAKQIADQISIYLNTGKIINSL